MIQLLEYIPRKEQLLRESVRFLRRVLPQMAALLPLAGVLTPAFVARVDSAQSTALPSPRG